MSIFYRIALFQRQGWSHQYGRRQASIMHARCVILLVFRSVFEVRRIGVLGVFFTTI